MSCEEEMTREELLETNEALRSQIKHLTNAMKGSKSRAHQNADQLLILELTSENEELQGKLDSDAVETTRLKDKLINAKLKVERATSEKLETEKVIKRQNERISELERDYFSLSNTNQILTREVKSLLAEKNERLRQDQNERANDTSQRVQVKTLTETIAKMETEKQQMQATILNLNNHVNDTLSQLDETLTLKQMWQDRVENVLKGTVVLPPIEQNDPPDELTSVFVNIRTDTQQTNTVRSVSGEGSQLEFYQADKDVDSGDGNDSDCEDLELILLSEVEEVATKSHEGGHEEEEHDYICI